MTFTPPDPGVVARHLEETRADLARWEAHLKHDPDPEIEDAVTTLRLAVRMFERRLGRLLAQQQA